VKAKTKPYQPDLFGTPAQTRAVTQAAIDNADDGAQDEWKALADDVIRWVCLNYREWTTDEVWRRYTDLQRNLGLQITANDRRAMGARILAAAKARWCRASNPRRYDPTLRLVGHRNPKLIWVSLLYQGHQEAAD
jgi:hypothetical protein